MVICMIYPVFLLFPQDLRVLQKTLQPVDDGAKKFKGIFRVRVALHAQQALCPVARHAGGGLAAGDGEVVVVVGIAHGRFSKGFFESRRAR